MDQATSQVPEVPRQQSKRDQIADLRCDDSLRTAASGRPNIQGHAYYLAFHGPRARLLVRTTRNRHDRTGPDPACNSENRQKLTRSDELLLCVEFPRTALPQGGKGFRRGYNSPPATRAAASPTTLSRAFAR